jgi:hypothetical protein
MAVDQPLMSGHALRDGKHCITQGAAFSCVSAAAAVGANNSPDGCASFDSFNRISIDASGSSMMAAVRLRNRIF